MIIRNQEKLGGDVRNALQILREPDYLAPTQTEDTSLQEYIAVFYRRRWLMLATVAVVCLMGLLYTATRKPIYQSTAKIVVVTGTSGSSAASDPLIGGLQALTRSRSIDTQTEIVASDDLLEEAFNSLSPDMRAKGFRSDSIPGWAYKISPKKNTDIITVTGCAYDPQAAAALANSISDTYFKLDLQVNNVATSQARKYAEDQMSVVRKDLAEANLRLSTYKSQTGLIAQDTQLAKVAEGMAQLQLDRDAAKADLASSERQTTAQRSQLVGQKAEVESSSTITRNPQFNAAKERIDALHSKRLALLQEYTPGSKEVRDLDVQIRSEETQLKKTAESVVGLTVKSRNPIRDTLLTKYSDSVASTAALEARVQAINHALNSRQAGFAALPEQERELSERLQKAKLLEGTYEMLSQKYYTLLLSERSTLANGRLISRARPSGNPAYPTPKKDAIMFLMLGLMLSVAAAIGAEKLDCRVHDQSWVESVTGAATLTAVPNMRQETPVLTDDPGNNGALLESFRILRSSISFAAVDREIKLLAVTSAGRSEGKSTTSANLAIVMGMDGKRVLLVDCDLRRPSVHKTMKISRNVGLTNVATGACTPEEAIVPTGFHNVFCMSSGPIPPNPVEILNSQHCRQMFHELASDYDMIILDCPPCTGLSDVQVVSNFVDAVLLVVCMDRTLKPQLQITARTLALAEAPLIGVALNQVDSTRQGYGYYYYYDYTEDGGAANGKRHKSKHHRSLTKV